MKLNNWSNMDVYKRWTRGGVYVFFFLSLGGVLMAELPANASKRNAMSQHRKHFEDVYEEGKGSSAVWMQKFLGRAEDESISAEDWRRALAIIVGDSKKGKFKQGSSASGFVQDDQTMTLLISALKDKGESGRTFSVDTLIWGVSKSIRKQHAKEIQKALGHSPKLREERLLFAKCNLTSAQKKKVLAWESVPVAARALCGDSKAEAELILEFQKSVEYFEKAKLARQ